MEKLIRVLQLNKIEYLFRRDNP